MREIKFRVWDYDGKKMITSGIEFELVRMNADVVDENDDIGFNGYGDRFDVMQYTGLKDKNGKDIYEGDIVKILYNNLGNVIVSYKDGRFSLYGYLARKCLIIGNIHESPELLGKIGI